MAETLVETILDVKRKIQDVTENVLLNLFDSEKCRELDNRSNTDPFVRRKVKECIRNLALANVDHTSHYDNAFNAYNEVVVFDILSARCIIEPVKEADESTPDYIITTKENGHRINVDLKTASFNEGGVNFRSIQKQYTESKISLEDQQKLKKATVHFGKEVTVSPFKKMGKDVHLNRKGVIESINDKTRSLYKPEQLSFENSPGILLIDTKVWGFPYFLQEALPYFIHPGNALMSGALWQACFGEIGERTFDFVEAAYHPNIGKPLAKRGVLLELPRLKAVVYILHRGNEKKLAGLHCYEMEDEPILEALGDVCDFVNDDRNSRFFWLPLNPLQ